MTATRTTATPFRTVLVANRGEIALRVMRTARRMGYGTVAVHSSADTTSAHVRFADRAVLIGGPLPAESYLDIPAIIDAAKASGADAVHPGYGFLAENAAFANACREAGLVFIGPSPESIEAMGDKARAKAFMQAAGVPVVPGYQGDDQSEARFAAEAQTIGFPVMIKAVAGGGGRGMRLVADAASLPALLASAQSEAKNAFADATVLIEKAVVSPRHIEIQVFGDCHGNALHLGERDCSVQRRHQKLVEEAPSPAVSDALRARMGEVSVKAVQALGYEGAGTLEFLLDRDGGFYFMEMNTRLQVEHPVTEAITGLDLVEWQLRVAAGEALPLAQHELRFAGHAIEVRLCAEDPAHDFMPQSGRFGAWAMPEMLRVETAMADGAEVPPFYDSMVAKLIAHGPTRDAARLMLAEGLARATALGVATNQGFLKRVLEHEAFAAGEATTAFVGAHGEALASRPSAILPDAALAALILFVADSAPRHRARARHVGPPLPVPMLVEIGGTKSEVAIHRDRDGGYRIDAGDQRTTVIVEAISAAGLRLRLGALALDVPFHRVGADLFIQRGADQIHVRDLTRAATKPAGSDGSDGRLVAAMNGRIVAVHAAIGEDVAAGQPLVTLEAMKMEHVHAAPVAGRLVEIAVTPGEQVTTGRLMAAIEKTA
ncbi:MAG: ATP-grasp domain-containing protein [Phreatobacter sp.]|uniref:acetyl/propionyl/methylcrotonyl-CoA carboxylase subunit alpha n=1 Tax=Phreatobacter sp. TaxID=1966341 RepID=UPI001A5AB96F|nr:biotin carboxylase N-terminal domain-containing protein [Phreatobacter sp.]MBL8570573.1 ATP-grasp domain-containing protein [Phreatobacter sp.]